MIDMNKKFRTRDGRPVRLLCTDRENSPYPVIGLLDDVIHSWTSTGNKTPNHEGIYDLIEDKPKIRVERWINVGKNGLILSFTTEQNAKGYVTDKSLYLVIAQHHVWEET